GRAIRALGAADRRRQAQTRLLPRRGQTRAVQGRLYFRSLRSFARLDRRSHAGAARGRARARYGLAVRLLQPEIMPVRSRRQRSGAAEPALLAAAMRRGGFRPYDKEWWHFTLNNEPFPDTYFDFPVR